MSIRMDTVRRALPWFLTCLAVAIPSPLFPQEAAQPHRAGGEANLVIPDLTSVEFLGMPGRTLLMTGLLVCGIGLLFGLMIYRQLRRLPVHASMREISELIYETCKTYLTTQGKFILILWVFLGL